MYIALFQKIQLIYPRQDLKCGKENYMAIKVNKHMKYYIKINVSKSEIRYSTIDT